MSQLLSVSALNIQIRSLIESTFEIVSVKGELSRVTYHSSGHVYFSIKDNESSIKCVMFKGNVSKLKFKLEEGLEVVLEGAISVYVPRGEYQLNCNNAFLVGDGSLMIAYEKLKEKLKNLGYFREDLKKPLPKFPQKIALVTSFTGAALQDILKTADKRWRLCKIDVYDSLVQGVDAPKEIASSIKNADTKNYDVIIVTRGGGSIEDLWAFNSQEVADEIFNAKTPIISAVGHQIDYVISDFVADFRAPTPTGAIEALFPNFEDIYIYIQDMQNSMQRFIKQLFLRKNELLLSQKQLLEAFSVKSKIKNRQEIILGYKQNFIQILNFLISKKTKELDFLKEQYIILDPSKKVKDGMGQIVKNGFNVSLENIKKDDDFYIISQKTKVYAKAIEVKSLD